MVGIFFRPDFYFQGIAPITVNGVTGCWLLVSDSGVHVDIRFIEDGRPQCGRVRGDGKSAVRQKKAFAGVAIDYGDATLVIAPVHDAAAFREDVKSPLLWP